MVDVYGDALVGSEDPELRKSLRYVCEVVDTEWSVKLHANELMGAVECLLSQQTLSSVEWQPKLLNIILLWLNLEILVENLIKFELSRD